VFSLSLPSKIEKYLWARPVAYPSILGNVMGSTRVDSSLACKYQIKVEGVDFEKHSSLLKIIQFYSTGPGIF
jgi:hypothetical protein